jgi:hypothetical protein
MQHAQSLKTGDGKRLNHRAQCDRPLTPLVRRLSCLFHKIISHSLRNISRPNSDQIGRMFHVEQEMFHVEHLEEQSLKLACYDASERLELCVAWTALKKVANVALPDMESLAWIEVCFISNAGDGGLGTVEHFQPGEKAGRFVRGRIEVDSEQKFVRTGSIVAVSSLSRICIRSRRYGRLGRAVGCACRLVNVRSGKQRAGIRGRG